MLFQVRCWEVEASGKTVPKAVQGMDGPILDVAWHDVSLSPPCLIAICKWYLMSDDGF